MIHKVVVMLSLCAAMLMLLNTHAAAQFKPRMAGAGMRGSYWDLNSGPSQIRIIENRGHHEFSGGGAGGWLYFISRTSDQWFLEFSLGGSATKVEEIEYFDGNEVHVQAIVPVLLGMRCHLLSLRNTGPLRPYIAFGAGPYWIADVLNYDTYFEEETTVDTKLRGGGYAGAGADFMLTDWLGINFDARHHFVNFDVNDDLSGFEYSLGMQFMWGSYLPKADLSKDWPLGGQRAHAGKEE